ARHLAERRVRLLRRLREHAHTDATLLRADLERGTLGLGDDLLASLTDELTDSRHSSSNGLAMRLAHDAFELTQKPRDTRAALHPCVRCGRGTLRNQRGVSSLKGKPLAPETFDPTYVMRSACPAENRQAG